MAKSKYPKFTSKRKPAWHARLKQMIVTGFSRLAMIAAAAFVIMIAWVFFTLPSIDQLYQATKAPSVVIKTEEGTIIGSYGDTYGDFLTYKEFPKTLVQAVIATEDRNFFHHPGIDPMGMARALFADVKARGMVQGGSTITQQVAKNIFLTNERTFGRKIREMLLAFRLEKRFTKQEILTIYLNRVYLGAGNYGVDAASRRYFGKSARELSLSESAILAGLLKAPSRFAPTSNPQASYKRAEQILSNMVDAGFLTVPEAERAKRSMAQTLTKTTKGEAASARYFTDWIMDQLQDMFGELREDIVVTTTFKPELQHAAQQAIAKIMDEQGEKMHASQAAMVAMTPDGAVRVMIGGRSYGESQYNRAAQARRQPGSSFKIFVYLAGLEAGYTPNTPVVDQPVTFQGWSPKNYTNEYKGEMLLKDAVAQSINTVAVQVAERAGLNRVVAMAQRLGVTSDLLATPSLALGSNEVTLVELVTAYAHLASNGIAVQPYGILRVETAQGEELYSHVPSDGERVLREGIVGEMNTLLEGVIQHGTGRAAAIGRPAAGKTGTTSDYRDAWFMGYTPDLVAGVWVGNDDNTPMKKVTGGTLPAPIWREFMSVALKDTPAHDLPESSGFWESIMPGGPPADGGPPSETPMEPSAAPAPQAPPSQTPPPAAEPEHHGVFHLGPSFWNKLVPDKGQVERSYPSDSNRR